MSSVSSNNDTLASAKAIKAYADSKDITVNAVTNETTVNRTGNAITVGLPNNVTVAGTLTVSGSGTTTAISIPNEDNVTLGSIQSVSGVNYDAPVGGNLTIHKGGLIFKGDSAGESGITWNRFNGGLSVTNGTYSIYGTSTLRYTGGRFDFTATTGTDNKVAEVRANNFRATNGFSRASSSAGPLLTTGSDNAWSTGDSASHGTTILYADSTSRIKADITVDAPAASGNTFALETSSSYPYADVSGVTDLSKKVAISTTAADADTNAEFPITFINNTGGNTYSSVNYHDLEKDAGILKYNPSTGTLSATSFVGNIAGSSTVAEKVTVVNEESASASHFLAFVDGVSSSRDIHADSGLTYVPSTGTLTVDNLTVAGTTTTLNTATLDIADKNITIGKNATTLASINNAGITFGNFSGNPIFSWDNGNSRFNLNKSTNIVGNLTVSSNLTVSGTTSFTGSIKTDIESPFGTVILDSGTGSGTNAFVRGNVKSPDGTTVLFHGTGSGTGAFFTGKSTRVNVLTGNVNQELKLISEFFDGNNDNYLTTTTSSDGPTLNPSTGTLTAPELEVTYLNATGASSSSIYLRNGLRPLNSASGTLELGSSNATFSNVNSNALTAYTHLNILPNVSVNFGASSSTTFNTGATFDFTNATVSGLSIGVSDLAAGSIQLSSESFSDSDSVLMTAAAVNDRITSFGYSTTTGTVTNVAAGSGLSGGPIQTTGTLNLNLNGLNSANIDSSQDSIVFIDSTNNGSRKESIADFATNFVNGANSALTASSGKLSLNLNGLASGVLSVPNDSIVFIDANGSASKKESVADFVGAIAGTNLTQDSTNKTLGILTETIEDIVGAMFTDSFVTYSDNGASNGTITISQSTSSGVNIGGSEDNTNHYLLLSSGAAGSQSLLTDAILRFDTTDNTLNVPKLAITDNLTLSGATVSSAINPNANNSLDIGSSTAKWKDIYIHGNVNFGNLNDGTNSIGSFVTTVANSSNTTVPTEGAVKTYVDGKTGTAAVADGGQNLATGDQIHTFVTGQNYVTSSGVTDISVGTALDITNSTTTPTISLDLSELTDMTAGMAGTDEFIVLDAGSERRKAANEIGLSIFSNDSSFTSNAGTVTSIASGNGLQTNQAGSGAINDSGSLSIKLASGSGLSVGSGGLSTNLAVEGLNNVTISSLASGQILKYNGTAWVNAADVGTTQASATTLGIAKFDSSDFDVNSGTGNVTLETVFTNAGGAGTAFGSSDTAAGSAGQKKVIGTITIDSKGRVTAVAEKTLTGFVPDSDFYNQAGIMVSDGDGTYSRRDIAGTIVDGDTKIPTSDAVHSHVGAAVSGLLTQAAADTRYFQSGGSDNINATHLDFGQGTNQITIDNIPEKSVAPTNVYFTNVRARTAVSVGSSTGDGSLTYNNSNGQFTYTGPGVTQYRGAVSVTDSGGDGSLSYDSSTGVFTYTGPSASETRAHFSGGTGVSYNSSTGAISIGQEVGTTSNVTFNNLTINGNTTLGNGVTDTTSVSGNLTVAGNTTLGNGVTDTTSVSGNLSVAGDLTVSGGSFTVDATSLSVKDSLIELARDNSSSDLLDIGLYGKYDTSGSQDLYAGLFRDASDGKWKLFEDAQNGPSSNVIDIDPSSNTGYTKSKLVADLEGTADVATKVTVTANNTESNSLFIPFVDGDSGNRGLETDNQLRYNPSTGRLSAGNIQGTFIGNLTGNVTGNITGNITGGLTGNVSGNAGSATVLQNSRAFIIRNEFHAFDGTQNVNLTNAIGTLFPTNEQYGTSISYDSSGGVGTEKFSVTTTALYNGTTKKLEATSTAIEATAHILPSAHDTYDLGSSAKRFRKIFVEEGEFAANTITVGTKTISSDADGIIVSGDLTATNITGSLTGNVTGAADTLTTPRNFTVGSTDHSFNGSADINLTEAVQDAVAAMFTHSNHTSVSASYDDTNGEIDLTSSGGSGSAGDPIVSVSENAPSSPSAGSLWFDPSDLTPYLYYNDGNSAQWIEFTPGGGGSTNIGISENAPSSPASGDLWFDPSDLTPYIYYNDGNSAQWIQFTPGGNSGSRDANWSIKTSAYSSGSNEKLIFTGSSALTLTLPASPAAGNFIQIKNKTTQNLTVNRNGNNIESAASNAIVSSGTLTEFVYVDSTQGWIEL